MTKKPNSIKVADFVNNRRKVIPQKTKLNIFEDRKLQKIVGIALTTVVVGGMIAAFNIQEKIADDKGKLISARQIEQMVASQRDDSFREAVRLVNGEAIIIVSDKRPVGSREAVYLTENSDTFKRVRLDYVEMQSEAVHREEKDYIEYYVTYKVGFRGEVWRMVDRLNKLADISDIVCAEPNFISETVEVYSREVDIEKSPHTSEVDDGVISEYQWFLDELNISARWNTLERKGIVPGENVVVAVIDTGVMYDHSALKDSMWVNKGEIANNSIDDDGNGYTDDMYGIDTEGDNGDPYDTSDTSHGTHIASCIAMRPDKNRGTGVAYGSEIMAIKAADDNGNLAYTSIIEGIRYAYENGADIINMSFGGPNSVSMEMALKEAYNEGCISIAAAGNDGAPTTEGAKYVSKKYDLYDNYPAASEYVLGVMAYDENGKFAEYSNWDYTDSTKYSVVAPGSDIFGANNKGQYEYKTGTSMATAVVSGIAALVKSYYRDESLYDKTFIVSRLHSMEDIVHIDENRDIHTYKKIGARIEQTSIRDCDITVTNIRIPYTGKEATPKVVIKDGDFILKEGVDYTLKVEDNTSMGTKYVRVEGKGEFVEAKNKVYYIVPPTLKISLVNSVDDKRLGVYWTKSNVVDGYQLYRYTTAQKKYKLVQTIKSNSVVKYLDTGLSAGTEHLYKVRAYKYIDGKYLYGDLSLGVKMITRPSKVRFTSGTKDVGSATMKWSTSSTATGYQVWRYNTSKKQYQLVKTIKGKNNRTYTNKGLKRKTIYKYKVRPYKTYGGKNYYGAYSEIMTVKTR